MKLTLSVFSLATVLFSHGIEAHGFVQQLRINGATYYDTWNPYKDPSKKLDRITRKFLDNGPVTDGAFLTGAITCNYGAKDTANNTPSPLTASIPAGAKVEFLWTEWTSDHPGPVITYLAKCPGKCADFSATTGNIWVKINQEGYNASYSVPWASRRLPNQNSTWPITLPKSIQNGEYILRHEILGLQRSVKPELSQFYPACHQITVTGGGATVLPTGVALPGAYQLEDPGIHLEYRDISATNPYTPPGGKVWGDGGWY